ncbi:MAG: carbohydrate binding family 9 domain-containing protein [Candidatus Aminicenantes bacterium]|nr:carbohydrate binding family 9 domain-containing protein [Candidatus Aminicenantes bacterium]
MKLAAKFSWALTLIIIIFLSGAHLQSQERTKVLFIQRTDTPPKIDGQLDDQCWKEIQPVSGFIQYNPVNGAPASEETLVWATYDDKNIYFAFLLKDSQPEKIWAELTPRNRFQNNDSITVILDTYNDRRTSVSFTVNPKGVQKNSVETIWKSAARIRKDGWAAEMAIPFKSLRFSSSSEQVWGINFARYIHRLNETDYWTEVKRDLPRLQQMAELRGLSGIKPGQNLEFYPYLGVRSSRWEEEKDDKLAAGLDVKYGLKPNLYLDITASPDFSQVESDPFIYQLSPYENYLRENRPFFSEGSEYFRLKTEHGFSWPASVRLFYSRRIKAPRLAAKITGKTDGFSFGLLGALNKTDYGSSQFGIFRITKDIFSNSQVGLYYTGVREETSTNQNVAFDYSFNFKNIYYLRGASIFSFDSTSNNSRNGIYMIEINRWPDAGLQMSFGFQRIEDNVSLKAGYLNRLDLQAFNGSVGYAWRFNQGTVQRFRMNLSGNLNENSHGLKVSERVDFSLNWDFFNRIDFSLRAFGGRSQYQVQNENEELLWNGEFLNIYGGRLDFGWEKGGLFKDLNLELGWQKKGIYNEDFTLVLPGSQLDLEASFSLKPRSNVEISLGADYIQQNLSETGEKIFAGLTYEASLHYQITHQLFISTRILGETREDQYNFDLLLGYYLGAGSIVQLSYKTSQHKEFLEVEKGRSTTLKISYLLRI